MAEPHSQRPRTGRENRQRTLDGQIASDRSIEAHQQDLVQNEVDIYI